MEFTTTTNAIYNGYISSGGNEFTIKTGAGTVQPATTTGNGGTVPITYTGMAGDGMTTYINPNTFTLPNNGGLNGQYFTFPAVPDLDALQEGIFDIKGGKIIIKKIKVTQEQIDESEDWDTFEGKSSKEEDEVSSEDRQEREYFCAGEEREV